MTESDVTREGLRGVRPGSHAHPGRNAGPWRRRRRGERPMVPPAEFTSYYGKPVINRPVWSSPDIPGYLFLGGLAGASSLLGAGAQLTGRPSLARTAKAGAFGAGCLSMVALVHDLGRPARFANMLRVLKVSSPMSVGSWLLSGYVPAAGVAAACALTGRFPLIGAAATGGAALLGPPVAAYTAALISDTAVPAWHDGYPEMPFVFAGSAATAAGGLGLLGTSLLAASPAEAVPARNLGLFGACLELAAAARMTRRIGMVAEPYHSGRGGAYMKAGEVLAVLGVAGSLAGAAGPPLSSAGQRFAGAQSLGRLLSGPRGRVVTAVSGAALLAASAATRWGIFHAGMASADDPKYTVVPQRERLARRVA
ncbi:MAG: polysulfide reductase NrfD [Streptosporangiaceae bacterium]|nr:polysulfide reductase NrfD [Streptosporangiaceae bacterium]MBV9857693.1 polysulfide reductase NrfD [Streptosporangiaceae bacterium]